MIGLSVYGSLGLFFRTQYHFFREDVASAGRNLTSSYLSAWILRMVGCKECDQVNLSLRISPRVAGYFLEMELGKDGLNVTTQPEGIWLLNPVHNLKWSFEMSGTAISSEPVSLAFNRPESYIKIGS